MYNQPSLEIRQIVQFNNSRKIYLSTLRRACRLANERAVDVATQNMLQGMATTARTRFQYYTDVESNHLILKMEQVITLSDDRRKYMSRVKHLSEAASEAALLVVEQKLPEGCIDQYGWEFSYLRTWSQGRESWDITWGTDE